MQIKTLLVDLDGVVLHRADYFSNRVRDLYPAASHSAIMDFFTDGTYEKISKGEIDLLEAITRVIANWNVGVSAEQLVKVWYEGENEIDTEVLSRVKEIRDAGVLCVIVTDHSKYRKDDVWSNLRMSEYFDDIVASADVGATKEDSGFFMQVMEKLKIKNSEIVAFIDDDPENVAVAKSLGMHAVVFEDIHSFDKVLK